MIPKHAQPKPARKAIKGTVSIPHTGVRPNAIATRSGTQPYTPARVAIQSAFTGDGFLGVDRCGEDRVVGALVLVLHERPEHRRERSRRAPRSQPSRSWTKST